MRLSTADRMDMDIAARTCVQDEDLVEQVRDELKTDVVGDGGIQVGSGGFDGLRNR